LRHRREDLKPRPQSLLTMHPGLIANSVVSSAVTTARPTARRAALPMPGLLWGDYPQRRPAQPTLSTHLSNVMRDLNGRVLDASAFGRRKADAMWLRSVHSLRHAAPPADLAQALQLTRSRLLHQGLADPAVAQALACVCQVAQAQLNLLPFDGQLLAARTVLHNGLAEMATGEGKTLAVALAAAVAALAGMPVHVVTANDYLVARDAQRLAPLYSALGLRVGSVVQPNTAAQRAAAYACDITYVSATELVFDYLRDGLVEPANSPAAVWLCGKNAPEPTLLRGLCMAIVDEADAVLIDEARVPLILSQADPMAAAQNHAQQALQFARCLHAQIDFVLNPAALSAVLTAQGRARLQRAASSLGDANPSAAWRHPQHREHAICMALVALHLLQLDKHYLLREGPGAANTGGPSDPQSAAFRHTVHIIDSGSGRVAEGRAWSQGLQQMVEAKEGCVPSPSLSTLAQLTYQRFFARYVRLGGLSGTLHEARSELLAHYNTPVRRVPLRRPCLRQVHPHRLFKDANSLWQAVASQVLVLHQRQRPVLIATDSVADAQSLVDVLAQRLPAHAAQSLQVLHARNDAHEAAVVARAGQRGAITVTTNMAGRGTDIELGPGVADLGGLHVICCQLNSARRIDRQLAGRAARQGDPGSVQTMLSLDNALLQQAWPSAFHRLLKPIVSRLPSVAVRALTRWPQRAEEHKQQLQRQRLMAQDERCERQLGFAGVFE
jgi:preprotein translocase subunit SecA